MTHLLEPVASESCENSKLAHGSSIKVDAKTLLVKDLLKKFLRLVTSPKFGKSLLSQK